MGSVQQVMQQLLPPPQPLQLSSSRPRRQHQQLKHRLRRPKLRQHSNSKLRQHNSSRLRQLSSSRLRQLSSNRRRLLSSSRLRQHSSNRRRQHRKLKQRRRFRQRLKLRRRSRRRLPYRPQLQRCRCRTIIITPPQELRHSSKVLSRRLHLFGRRRQQLARGRQPRLPHHLYGQLAAFGPPVLQDGQL